MQLAEMALNAVAEHQRKNRKPLDEGFLDIEWSFPFNIRKAGEDAKIMICDKNGKYPRYLGCNSGFYVAQP